jgi:hypothetical protein
MGLGGKTALVLDPEAPRLESVPEYPSDSGQIRLMRNIRFGEGSDIEVDETVTLSGYHGAWMRSYLNGVDSATRIRRIQDQISGSGSVVVWKLEADNLSSSMMPLVLNLQYRLPEALHAMENRIVGKVPAVWERLFLSVSHQEDRRAPYRIEYPLTVETEAVVEAPEGYWFQQPSSLSDSGQSELCSWSVDLKNSPQKLNLRYSSHRPNGNGPASEYVALEAAVNQSLEAIERQLIVAK